MTLHKKEWADCNPAISAMQQALFVAKKNLSFRMGTIAKLDRYNKHQILLAG
jgi:hypothetical protein